MSKFLDKRVRRGITLPQLFPESGGFSSLLLPAQSFYQIFGRTSRRTQTHFSYPVRVKGAEPNPQNKTRDWSNRGRRWAPCITDVPVDVIHPLLERSELMHKQYLLQQVKHDIGVHLRCNVEELGYFTEYDYINNVHTRFHVV
jgi:hypothetical protein